MDTWVHITVQDWREAQRLYDSGYRPGSNKYRLASRIDREDWIEHMAKHHAPWDPEGQGMEWASKPNMGDWYRSCLSKDKLTLDRGVYQALKSITKRCGGSSGWGYLDEFVPLLSPPSPGARALQL